ncbi:MAG: PHP domain-containing protein [Streptosporangiaceae bacterium]
MHTTHSGDASTTLDQLASRVADVGLDVVCVTDHHVLDAALAARDKAIGARVVVGEEIRTSAGELIGLFLDRRVPYVLPAEDVIRRIHDQGGIVYAPHPCDPRRSSVGKALPELCEDGGVDLVEIFNAKVGDPEINRRAAALARSCGLPAAAGSDAHEPHGVGAAYMEMPDFDGPRDFVDKLRAARLFGELCDYASAFSATPGGLGQGRAVGHAKGWSALELSSAVPPSVSPNCGPENSGKADGTPC